MSINESHDIDLVKYEEEDLTENQIDVLNEFVGQLQEAFAYANNSHMPDDLKFIAIEKTFREYFDKVDIEIKPNMGKLLTLLKAS